MPASAGGQPPRSSVMHPAPAVARACQRRFGHIVGRADVGLTTPFAADRRGPRGSFSVMRSPARWWRAPPEGYQRFDSGVSFRGTRRVTVHGVCAVASTWPTSRYSRPPSQTRASAPAVAR